MSVHIWHFIWEPVSVTTSHGNLVFHSLTVLLLSTLVNNSSNISQANSQGVTKLVVIWRQCCHSFLLTMKNSNAGCWFTPFIGCFFLPLKGILAQTLHGPLFPYLIWFMHWSCIFYWAVSREIKYAVYLLWTSLIEAKASEIKEQLDHMLVNVKTLCPIRYLSMLMAVVAHTSP